MSARPATRVGMRRPRPRWLDGWRAVIADSSRRMNGVAGERLLAAAVAFVAAQPDGPTRLLTLHRQMDNGLCRAHAFPVRWPCGTVNIASAALRLRSGQA